MKKDNLTNEEIKELKVFLKWNINILRETPKFKNARNRINQLTSSDELDWTVEVFENGYRYTGEGVRTKASQYINGLGESIRKPRGLKKVSEIWIGYLY